MSENKGTISVIIYASDLKLGELIRAVNTIQIMWLQQANQPFDLIVLAEKSHQKTIQTLIADSINAIQFIDINFERKDFQDALSESEPIFKKSVGIILYAAQPLFLEEKSLHVLKRSNKPILLVSNYSQKIKNMSIIRTLNYPIAVQNIGVTADDLGVFPPLFEHSSTSYPISKISHPNDTSIRDLLLKIDKEHSQYALNALEKSYSDERDLYFGFFQSIHRGRQYRCSIGHPVLFIENCVKRSLKFNCKNIDIILPIHQSLHPKTLGRNYRSVIQHFETVHPDKAIHFEFYQKSHARGIHLFHDFGEGDIHIRIFNIFPIAPDTFIRFLEGSKAFCLMAGEQCLIESIYHRKVPMFSMQNTDKQLYTDLIRLSVQQFGPKSYYALFLMKQMIGEKDDKIQANHILFNFVNEHEDQIAYEAKKLRNYFNEMKNLKTNLTSIVLPTLLTGRVYAQNALKHAQHVSMAYLCNLVDIYPDSKASVLTHAVQYNYFCPFLVFQYSDDVIRDYPELHSLVPDANGEYEIKRFTQTFSELLKKNKKIDDILLKNLLVVQKLAKQDEYLNDCLHSFVQYLIQREMRYQSYYPKLCRALSKMRLNFH